MSKKSPLNFGMPGQNPFMQYQTQNPALNNAMMFSNGGQNLGLQAMMAQQMQAEQEAAAQAQQTQQNNSFAVNQDPNNASAVGFNNAPASVPSSVPITTGGLSPQTQGIAEGMFGDMSSRQRIMNPNTVSKPKGLISF
tara:strand:+ start:1702 stop:2115 length:414 start_codon:yes stop_codon:yes gene_type:complete